MDAILLLDGCEEECEGGVRDGQGVEAGGFANGGVVLEVRLVVVLGAGADGCGEETL